MRELDPYNEYAAEPREHHLVDPSEVDLATLARRVRERLDFPAVGYVPGKTMIRNEVINELDCSAEIAEALVDTLEERGFIRYTGSRRTVELEPCNWEFNLQPYLRPE